jgi:DNA-binding NarL/FixJ family response regulator
MSIGVKQTADTSDASSEPGSRTTARVDLRPASPAAKAPGQEALVGGPAGRTAMLRRVLRSIERTVRPDDRICPYGVSHVAVAFGPEADAVTAKRLGERLARAVGQGLVGVIADDETGGPGGNGSSGARPTTIGTIPSTTVVTVDRLVGPGAGGGHAAPRVSPSASCARPSVGWHGPAPQLCHRTIVRYSTGTVAGYGNRHDDLVSTSGDHHPGTVLVVDPDPRAANAPGLAAQAAASLAGRLGFKTGVASLGAHDEITTDVDGTAVDLVVLVVGAEPTGGPSSWSSSTWCVPARLTRAYRSQGTDVLAVSSGATAGALVGCIEQGASVLFDFNALPVELVALSRSGATAGTWTPSRSSHRADSPLDALLKLTSSERRVLFYLTTGQAAQDIADDLVVSLATVRSHIRSILRKLEVRSQLAAVAVANSCGAFHDQSSHAS